MSFILDALKKSENERQRHIGPSLADVQLRRRHGDRPWWMVAVAALLMINLGVLLMVLTRDGREPASFAPPARGNASSGTASAQAPAVPSSGSPANTAPQRAAQNQPANPAVHSLADEANAYDPMLAEDSLPPADLAAAALVPDGPPVVRSINPAEAAPATSRPLFKSRAAGNNEVLPTHGDLTASGASLPELHLDIHVHSGDAAERFVFINMRKYVEGQPLSEGPLLERITAEGVILNHHGLRFLLPRS